MTLNTTPQTQTQAKNRRFDQATYNQLTALDGRLLESIAFDSKIQARRSPSGARYSTKPEAYFAKILACTRETISDHVRKLERLGILDVTRRRPVRGVWQTNLYKIRSWIWWRLGKCLRALRRTPSRVTLGSHIANPMRETRRPEVLEGGPIGQLSKDILARWEQRGIWRPPDTL